MATTKSTVITNFEASPMVLNDASIIGGRNRVLTEKVTMVTTTGQQYMLYPIPTNAVISSIKVWSGASGTSDTIDIGLYTKGSAVLDVDCLAAAVSVATAQSGTEVLAIANLKVPVWQTDLASGLTADPIDQYYIGFEANATMGAVEVGITVTYAID